MRITSFRTPGSRPDCRCTLRVIKAAPGLANRRSGHRNVDVIGNCPPGAAGVFGRSGWVRFNCRAGRFTSTGRSPTMPPRASVRPRTCAAPTEAVRMEFLHKLKDLLLHLGDDNAWQAMIQYIGIGRLYGVLVLIVFAETGLVVTP